MAETPDIFSRFEIVGHQPNIHTTMQVQYNDCTHEGSLVAPECVLNFEGENVINEFEVLKDVLESMADEERFPKIELMQSDRSNAQIIQAYVSADVENLTHVDTVKLKTTHPGRSLMIVVNLLELAAMVDESFRAKAEHHIVMSDAYFAMRYLEKMSMEGISSPKELMDEIEGFADIAQLGLLADSDVLSQYGGIAKIMEDKCMDGELTGVNKRCAMHIEALKRLLIKRIEKRFMHL